MAIYEVTTEKGTYQIETEDDQNPPAEPQKQKGSVADVVSQQLQNSLGPIGIGGTAQDLIQKGADFAGEKAATSLAEKGIQMAPMTGAKPARISPEAAALVGTGMQMTPDIIGSVMPGEAALNTGAKIAKTPSKAQLLTQTADDIQNDLSKLALKKTGLAREFNQKKIEAMTARKEAGKAIEAWESNIEGYKFGGQPEITESTRGLVKTIANLSPKKLAQKYDLKQLQELYDKAKGMGTQGLDAPLVTRAKQNITEAQDMFSPGIKDLREAFGNASKAVEGWANEFKMGKASVADMTKKKQLALADVKNQLKKTQAGRELLKQIAMKGVGAAATGLGLGAGYNLLK